MRILVSILILFVVFSFQIKNDEIQFEIYGNPTCLRALQKYKATYKTQKNRDDILVSLVAAGATVVNLDIKNNFVEFQVGEFGIVEFKFLEIIKNKPAKTLKIFKYNIC